MAAALAPLRALQDKAIKAHKQEQSEMIKNLALGKVKKSVKTAAAKKKLAKDPNADVSDLMQIDEAEEISVKRYSTHDTTYEKLGELMEQNPNGLLAESDELIGLLNKLDSQGQESARAFFLTAADGDKPYTFDRIMRGTLHLPAVCLSIIGGIQPGVLADYVRQAVSGGAGADGLLQRFGLMVFPDVDPHFKYVDRKPDQNARASIDKLVEYFDDQLEVMVQGEVAEYGDTIQFLRFDDEAQEIFIKWYSDLQQRLRSGDEHEAIVSHLSKYASLVPSLALIFHLCEHRRGAVDKKSLLRAIAYGEYLETHARRVYSFGTRPDVAAAKSLLAKITKGTLTTPFTPSDVYRHQWAGLETPAKAQAAINLLCEYRHLIGRTEETGGRPSTLYFHNGGK
jgi:putative DNA primase/helicase